MAKVSGKEALNVSSPKKDQSSKGHNGFDPLVTYDKSGKDDTPQVDKRIAVLQNHDSGSDQSKEAVLESLVANNNDVVITDHSKETVPESCAAKNNDTPNPGNHVMFENPCHVVSGSRNNSQGKIAYVTCTVSKSAVKNKGKEVMADNNGDILVEEVVLGRSFLTGMNNVTFQDCSFSIMLEIMLENNLVRTY